MGCNSSRHIEMMFDEEYAEDIDGDERGPMKTDSAFQLDSIKAGKPSVSVPVAVCVQMEMGQRGAGELFIGNLEDVPVFFKIKVTAPKLLVFKPIMGTLPPKNSVHIKVMTEVIDKPFDAPANVKAMVQTLRAKNGSDDKLPDEEWYRADRSILGQQKVNIDFVGPAVGATDNTDTTKNPEQPTAPWWKS